MTRISRAVGQTNFSFVMIFSNVFCFMILTPVYKFGAWSRTRTDCLRLMRPLPIPLVLPTQYFLSEHGHIVAVVWIYVKRFCYFAARGLSRAFLILLSTSERIVRSSKAISFSNLFMSLLTDLTVSSTSR